MKWTRSFPGKPQTYWWHRGRYTDGSTSNPVIIRVEVNSRWETIYRCMGSASSWLPDELEADYEAHGVVPEFAGPLIPPEENADDEA